MFHRKWSHALPLVVIATMVMLAMPWSTIQAFAGDSTVVLTSPMIQNAEPVTIYSANAGIISTLDPQRAEDEVSITPVENLFLGLTDVDPKTSKIRPEVATKWEKNQTGDVWTFTLRTDIPWVRWDPKAKQATKLRNVTAADFVYGIQRVCDPRLGAYYTFVAAGIIKGCDVVAKLPPNQINDQALAQIGAKAVSDSQLEITTQGPLGYFLDTTPMWMFRAVPKEIVQQFGEQWTDPGNIVTDGPYMLDTLDLNVNRIFVKNPYYPKDVTNNYGGNVERLNTIIVKDASTIYSLYQNNEVDSSGLPAAELNTIRSDPERSKELVQQTMFSTTYVGFMYDKPPFDNVHVRRAFSAVIDRKTYVQEILQGLGIPIAHFMPQGIRGSVPINEVGIGSADNLGFDPDYAKKEMEAAGYKDCANFPSVTLLTAGDTDTAQFLQNQIKTYLGCDENVLNIEEAEFSVQIQSIKPNVPTPQRPNMYTLAWGADYADANNWFGDVLSCHAEDDMKRPCGPLDDKITAAAKESDPAKRNQAYRDLETAFFGQDGEFPIAPIYVQVRLSMVKPWYKGFFQTDGLFGGDHWDTRFIDQAQQLAARPAKQ